MASLVRDLFRRIGQAYGVRSYERRPREHPSSGRNSSGGVAVQKLFSTTVRFVRLQLPRDRTTPQKTLLIGVGVLEAWSLAAPGFVPECFADGPAKTVHVPRIDETLLL
jgi:hypothetical protein